MTDNSGTHSFQNATKPLEASAQGSQGLRCPHCHWPVPPGEGPDISCSGCGGSFRLAGHAITSTAAEIRLLGRFQLLDLTGRGTFGEVWRARDDRLDRIVALKIPHPGTPMTDAMRERYHREARAAAQLRHPGLACVHEVLDLDGMPVMVSDFINGVPLKDLLDIRRLTFREAATLIAEVADALEFAHSRGLVHRDIKPANIIMENAGPRPRADADAANATAGGIAVGKPMLIDFGLALRDEVEIVMTIEGQLIGTPAYMSPEQAAGDGHRADRRSDVYSLGVVLYQLLCNELPFRGSKAMLLHQVVHEQPRTPRELNDRIPRDLDNICMKAMAKEPRWRYATAGDLGDDLRRHLQGQPIRARPIGPGQRLWLWCRRNPAIAALSGLAALGFTCLAILAVAFGLRERHNAETLKEALRESNAHLRNAQYRLAESHLSRSLAYCDRQMVGQGMLWLTRSLEAAPENAPDLRRYLRTNLAAWRTQHCDLQACIQLPATLRALAFNPEGTSCIAVCANGDCLSWQTLTGSLVRNLQLTERKVQAAAISPTAVITVSEAGTIRVNDLLSGQSQSESMIHPGRIKFAIVSKDGGTILVGGMDMSASLWQMEANRWIQKQRFAPGKVYSAALSADGALILTGSNDGARLWNTASGKILQTFPHEMMVTSAAFSADTAIVATGCIDGSARLWQVANGSALPFQVRHDHTINAVAISNDRKFLLTASEDKSARIWSIGTQKPIGSTLVHADAVKSAAFSSLGTQVVTGGSDKVIRIWNKPEQEGIRLDLPVGEWVRSAAFSPDGKLLLTAGGIPDKHGAAHLWDPQSGKYISTPLVHADLAWTASFDSDCRRILTASMDGSARLANIAIGTPGPVLKHDKPVHFAVFNPEGTTVLTGSADENARLWDAATGQPKGKVIDHQLVRTGAFSPKGDVFFTGSDDGTLRVWRSADQTPLFPAVNLQTIVCANFSHDGRFIIVGTMKEARLYDVVTGQLLDPPARHLDQVRTACFSHDDHKYLTASDDGTVQIWDTQTRSRLGNALVHGNPVNVAVFSPDDRLVLTGCRDGTFRIWDVVVGRVIGPTLNSSGRAVCVAFSPDGVRFLTSSSSQSAWLRETPFPLEYDLAKVALWVQVLTGTELDEDENVHVLDSATWQKRRLQLQGIGTRTAQ